MKHNVNQIRTLMIATTCAALTGCGDQILSPEVADGPGLGPTFLIGSSPLLADPRPSPWGGENGCGLTVDLEASKAIFGEETDRYAFRTTVTLTLGDGSLMAVNPKVDPAAAVDPRDDPAAAIDPKIDPMALSLVVPFSSSVSAALSKEKGAVRTDVTVELLDNETGSVLDRVQASAAIKY